MPGIDALLRAVKLWGRQTTTARCDARQSVRQGKNHQILNEADRENGSMAISRTLSGGYGIVRTFSGDLTSADSGTISICGPRRGFQGYGF